MKKGGHMPQWNEIQTHAKKIIDEGIKLLRAGMTEAEFIAEATAESAKLHIASRKDRLDIYKLLHELGHKVYHSASKDPSMRELKLTDAMLKIMQKVEKLERNIKNCEARIAKLTITKRSSDVQKRP